MVFSLCRFWRKFETLVCLRKLQQLCFAKLLVFLLLDAQNGAEFLVFGFFGRGDLGLLALVLCVLE